jgi:hypothetical protein
MSPSLSPALNKFRLSAIIFELPPISAAERVVAITQACTCETAESCFAPAVGLWTRV